MALIDFFARPRTLAAPRRPALKLGTLLDVWRSRRALERLDPAALDDIGLDRAHAAREAAKPIWDVPATWRY